MLGLNATLSIASQALSADNGALAITNNNVANVNTPGYSHQLVQLSADSLVGDGSSQDNGVAFEGYTSVRDELLQIGINQKTSDVGSLTTEAALWSQVQGGFSSTTDGLGASLSSFFSAVSGLSTAPDDNASRQSALSAAGTLINSFHQAAASLSNAQTQANGTVTGVVAEINQITAQIATLNAQLSAVSSSSSDGGAVQDQRDSLTTKLATLVGVTSISTESTPSLSTTNGSPLVLGNTAYKLQVATGADGLSHVLDAQGNDITGSLTGGSLGGALSVRDSALPKLQATLDTLASDFANAFNTAQAQGFDQNGKAGTALFSLPANGVGAAAGITLLASTSSSLALSSDTSSGGSGNIQNLLGVQTQKLTGGQTATDAYASLVQSIGDGGSSANTGLSATNAALTQLTTQQASESGVSLDEETTNLLRYQQAYTAAAKVISTVNTLYQILFSMGGAA